MSNRQVHRNNSLKVPAISQSLVSDLGPQINQCKSNYKGNLDKENILDQTNEAKTHTSRINVDKINGTYQNGHDKLENILCEQNTNVWNDGSVLPQVLLPPNKPQDIRRATYIKERKPCNGTLYECNEEVDENTECDKAKAQSDFSVLLNKLTFTPSDVISSSPEPARRESTESTASQIIDKYRTFNISHSNFFETSTIYDAKAPATVAPALQPAGLHLSPIKFDRCSLMNDIKDLISSSPIQFQHHVLPKDLNEYPKHFVVDINPKIQTNCEYFSFELIPKNEASKKVGDMYIEISPPRKHFNSNMVSMSVSKLSGAKTGRIKKNNTLCNGGKKLQLSMPSGSKFYLKKKIVFLIILILIYVL